MDLRKKSMFRHRAQVDAPIELVVAIIVLVMSLSLAFLVIKDSETGRCLANLKTQTQQLQESMLDVALGSAGSKKTITFSMPRCADKSVEGLEFVQYKSAEFCQLCPGHFGGCWQIIPLAKTSTGMTQLTDAITCVELPVENVRITQESRCQPLTDSACPADAPHCAEDLRIPSAVNSKAVWRTLGSNGGRDKIFTITFSKSTIGGAISTSTGAAASEQSEIRICALAGPNATPPP